MVCAWKGGGRVRSEEWVLLKFVVLPNVNISAGYNVRQPCCFLQFFFFGYVVYLLRTALYGLDREKCAVPVEPGK